MTQTDELTIKEALNQAAEAIKRSDIALGKTRLKWVLQKDPNNVLAWLWMSRCFQDREIKLKCFTKVLEIDPSNKYALEGIQRLGRRNIDVTKHKNVHSPRNRSLIMGGAIGFSILAILIVSIIFIPKLISSINQSSGIGSSTDEQMELSIDTAPITTQEATRTARPSPTIKIGTRGNPYPYNSTVNMVKTFNNQKRNFTLKVAETIRGEQAWELIHEAGMFNSEPPPRMEYLLTRLEVAYMGEDQGVLNINKMDVASVSNGQVFSAWDAMIIGLEDVGLNEFDVSIYPGASADGWIPLLVFIEDSNPLLGFGIGLDGSGGIFISLLPEGVEGQEVVLAPTDTPTIQPTPDVKSIGPIYDSQRDEEFSLQISITGVEFFQKDGFSDAKQGFIFTLVHLNILNLGPNTAYSIGTFDFQVRDENGALRDSDFFSEKGEHCWLESVDLMAGGTISGCIKFEVPAVGRLEFIYAPYKYEGLVPGRYLSFTIRQ